VSTLFSKLFLSLVCLGISRANERSVPAFALVFAAKRAVEQLEGPRDQPHHSLSERRVRQIIEPGEHHRRREQREQERQRLATHDH